MTQVRIDRVDGRITGFSIQGHTGYAPSGEDIVCAAISAIGQTALIGLTEVLGLDPKVGMDAEKGSLRVALPADAPKEAQVILETMLAGLANIQIQFPDYIRIHRNGGTIVC